MLGRGQQCDQRRVAQLVEAPDLGSGQWRFESSHAYNRRMTMTDLITCLVRRSPSQAYPVKNNCRDAQIVGALGRLRGKVAAAVSNTVWVANPRGSSPQSSARAPLGGAWLGDRYSQNRRRCELLTPSQTPVV